MSRRKTQADLEREAEEADLREALTHKRQRECGHYYGQPTEWHWSGQIRTMRCFDCGLEEYREEV